MNTLVRHTFTLEELNLDTSSMARMMGYEKDAPEAILEMIDRELVQFEKVDGIEGGYAILDAQLVREKHVLAIGKYEFQVGKSVYHHLRKAEQVALLICTAGEMISERSKALMSSGDLMEGYVVDIIGSTAVEAAMDKISDRLKTSLELTGNNCTNRYSPGYCGWDVAEQSQLFSFFPEAFCGVTLTDSCLMMPIKSVSGVMGIGKNVTYKPYTCSSCDNNQCIYKGKKN